MDKKTILAFALSFAVLLIWSFLFNDQQKQEVKEAPVTEERTAAKSQYPDGQTATSPTALEEQKSAIPRISETLQKQGIPQNKLQEKEIEVDTPLYTAVLSNIGPTIKSFKLKKYRQSMEVDSPPIEIVNMDAGMGDFLLIDFLLPFPEKSGNKIYEIKADALSLRLDSPPRELTFQSLSTNGLNVTQTFRFYPDQYRIDVDVHVLNQSDNPAKGAFVATLKALPPKEKKGYYSYVGLVALVEDELEEVELEDAPAQESLSGKIEWIAYEDDYFISALTPTNASSGKFSGRLLKSGLLEAEYLPPPIQVNPLEKVSSGYRIYIGPRDLGLLKDFGNNLERAVHFGWTDIISKPLLYLLRFFNQYINNYGLSIILLTILIKILFWPLTHKSYKSMKEMQKLQPRMAKIREKYKGNKEQMNKEIMALYKTYKVNPMGGCLPMVIQIPVFFALFRILGNAIELRHAPFMLWINDLSAPDRLFRFPFEIPFMAPPYGIPILTLLMGASMFIQQKMTPTPGDPTQAKIMMFLPIIFTVMFINFPSGLVLYWLVNNILSIGQQYRIHRK